MYELHKKWVELTIQNEVLRLAYSSQGAGKQIVLFLHGFLSSRLFFEKIIFPLMPLNDYRFIAIDFPGFGGSDAFKLTPHSLGIFSDVVAAFIKKEELEGCNIYSVSMGGAVALILANKYPELLGNIAVQGPPDDGSKITQSRKIIDFNWSAFLRKAPSLILRGKRMFARTPNQVLKFYKPSLNHYEFDQAERNDIYAEILHADLHAADTHAVSEIVDSLVALDISPLISNLHTPLLIIDGGTPPPRKIGNIGTYIEQLPRTTPYSTINIPKVGHFATMFAPQVCLFSALGFFGIHA
jgi:pimeloyl-ACP methyl ester carboxylesterase